MHIPVRVYPAFICLYCKMYSILSPADCAQSASKRTRETNKNETVNLTEYCIASIIIQLKRLKCTCGFKCKTSHEPCPTEYCIHKTKHVHASRVRCCADVCTIPLYARAPSRRTHRFDDASRRAMHWNFNVINVVAFPVKPAHTRFAHSWAHHPWSWSTTTASNHLIDLFDITHFTCRYIWKHRFKKKKTLAQIGCKNIKKKKKI